MTTIEFIEDDLRKLALSPDEDKSPVWTQLRQNGALATNSVQVQSNEDILPKEKQDEESVSDSVSGALSSELRDYQKELAETALKGKNTIIYAPTGSGKTMVALHIIQEHLQQVGSNPKKVIFLARTVHLVEQQYKFLKSRLPSHYKVSVLSGVSTSQTITLDTDVLVMTPMILVNHITKEKCQINMFSMLVFDECQHTTKGEPYNKIMLFYLKQKKISADLPQIVGLTASIGIGKARDKQEAKDNILKICGNMDVDNISSVIKNKEELEKLVPRPEERQKELEERHTSNESGRKFAQLIQKLEEYVAKYAKPLKSEDLEALVAKIPSAKQSQGYGQWARKLKRAAREVPILNSNKDTAGYVRNLIILSEYLMSYNAALELHDLIDAKDVMEYLANSFKNFERNKKNTSLERTLYGDFDELRSACVEKQLTENGNLRILTDTLQKHLLPKDDQSRCIIFVKTKALSQILARWLNRCGTPELKAASFIGRNTSDGMEGMSRTEQNDMIEQFRSGKNQLLVATSIAEEGLDVPDCKLVVKYNHIGNEVTSVQTRGRSRAEGGISYLLAKRDILETEKLNRTKVEIMEKAIENIQTMLPSERKKIIEQHQQKIVNDGLIADANERKAKARLRNVNFRMVCSWCRKVYIGKSNIRLLNGTCRISLDRALLDRIHVLPYETAEFHDDVNYVGTVYCKGEPQPGTICGQKLGSLIRHQMNPFIALGVKNFEFDTGKSEHYGKWKKVPYHIDDLETEDILKYIEAEIEAAAGSGGSEDLSGKKAEVVETSNLISMTERKREQFNNENLHGKRQKQELGNVDTTKEEECTNSTHMDCSITSAASDPVIQEIDDFLQSDG